MESPTIAPLSVLRPATANMAAERMTRPPSTSSLNPNHLKQRGGIKPNYLKQKEDKT